MRQFLRQSSRPDFSAAIFVGHPRVRQVAFKVLSAIAIAIVLTSCGASKSSQCGQLSSTVNKIRPIAEKFQQEGKTFETAAKAAGAKNDLNAYKTAAANLANSFTGLTGELDGLIQEIQGIQLKDPTLIGLRDRYIKTATAYSIAYKENSNTLRTISKIENTPQGLQNLRKSVDNLAQTASRMNGLRQDEDRFVADFNEYCGANK